MYLPPQALLLMLCFDEGSLDTADGAIKSLFQCGSPEAFVEWTRHCGLITPQQANRVSHTMPRGYWPVLMIACCVTILSGIGFSSSPFRARNDIRLTLHGGLCAAAEGGACVWRGPQATHTRIQLHQDRQECEL